MGVKSEDKKWLGRDEPSRDLVVKKSKGAFVFDEKKRSYIDFVAGWCVGNLGWDLKEIKKAAAKDFPDYVYPNFIYEGWVELARLLAKVAPKSLKKTFRTVGGTESVDLAMQIAMTVTKRHQFISIEGAYHGNSIGAMSIGSSFYRKMYDNLLPHCHKIETPLDEKALRKVEAILKRKQVAAFIMEPIICNLGVYAPEKAFIEGVNRLCKKYGTLFVMDEVATGFGRTGKLFATEHFDLEPDIMTLAKGITSGLAPLGATLVTEKVSKALEGKFSFYSTFGWHPYSTEIAIATLKYWIKNEKKLLKNVSEQSHYFHTRLKKMGIKDINIKGLAISFQVKDPKKLEERARQKGLIIHAESDKIVLFPPLNIDRQTVKEGLDVLERIL